MGTNPIPFRTPQSLALPTSSLWLQQALRRHCRANQIAPWRTQATVKCKKQGRHALQVAAIAEAEVELEDGGKLEINKQSYQSIFLEGCEVLISVTPAGKMDLNNVYVRDEETDIYARPSTYGDMPETPHSYHELEWAEEYTGDTVLDKEGYRKVYKVYLVQVEQEEPFRLNLKEIYSIDYADRVLRKEQVQQLTEETDPRLITLRITADGLGIEENSELPSEEEIVYSYLQWKADQRILQAEEDDIVVEADQDVGAPRDPIDALNDDEREYDESQEDTPAIDQGY